VLLAGVVGAAAGAGVLAGLGRAARYAAVLAVLVALINPLTARYGLTVLWRFGEVPPLGRLDITLEALAYGGVLGLRVLVVVLAAALFSLAIDPDALLRLLRRVSLRSALTAVLATRLVPVLARDARRLEDARRCRPDGGGTGPRARTAVLRALSAGALDRAVDVAATLEVRGYASRGLRRGAPARTPWSRHDLAFAAAALVVVALAAVARLAGVAAFSADPVLRGPVGPPSSPSSPRWPSRSRCRSPTAGGSPGEDPRRLRAGALLPVSRRDRGRPRGREPRDRAGRVRRGRRPVGGRQEHAAAGAVRPGAALPRRGVRRPGRRRRAGHARARPRRLAAVAGTLLQDPETRPCSGRSARSSPSRSRTAAWPRPRSRAGWRRSALALGIEACSSARRTSSRAARSSAWRSGRARGPPAGRPARRADLPARPGGGRRARVVPAAA
jgi:energy-coupling factor transport system permease protein